jgi:hypothetical protein
MGLFLMVLGFIWWWPLGLIILVALIANGRIGYRRRLQFAGGGPTGDWDHVTRMDHMAEKAERVPAKTGGLRDRVRGNWGQPSSGNRAFDEHRAETLRRLEDEQREFKEFLKRLRVAKDRTEFDLFMNQRRSRPADRRLDAPSTSIVATDSQGVSLPSNGGSPWA